MSVLFTLPHMYVHMIHDPLVAPTLREFACIIPGSLLGEECPCLQSSSVQCTYTIVLL